MSKLFRSPYTGLVLTGLIATAALIIEARLNVSQDMHYLFQFIWVGVFAGALLAFALRPSLLYLVEQAVKRDNDRARLNSRVDEE